MADYRPHTESWRYRLFVVIFEADTRLGKAFDVLLLFGILASIAAVCLESVEQIRSSYGSALIAAEWAFTVLFTVEYALRLFCVRRPLQYATSFYGVVDLMAVLPTYLSLFVPEAQALLVIRSLRLLRVFRVFKLGRYVSESQVLITALRNSRPKIVVFLFTVVTLVLIIGASMYLVEGPEHGFTSIPVAMYWAVVTMTTVGYGDIIPETAVGQLLASGLMVTGYAIIAVPTGIVTAELTSVTRERDVSTRSCQHCSAEGHRSEAFFCHQCGVKLL